MQRIDKLTIYSAFWNTCPATVSGPEANSSSDKTNKIALFTSSKPSSLGDDEISSEFMHKIASLHNFVAFEYEVIFSWSNATSSWWIAFLEIR
jgi:hypothetical protein